MRRKLIAAATAIALGMTMTTGAMAFGGGGGHGGGGGGHGGGGLGGGGHAMGGGFGGHAIGGGFVGHAIGGGFGGMEAAKRLKKADVDVTVVDRHNHLLFQPLIYQVAAGVHLPVSSKLCTLSPAATVTVNGDFSVLRYMGGIST